MTDVRALPSMYITSKAALCIGTQQACQVDTRGIDEVRSI